MKIEDLKEGMKLKVRTWESMLAEFGGDDRAINCKYTFTRDMREFCGTVVTVTKTKTDATSHLAGDWHMLPQGRPTLGRWTWSLDMVEPDVDLATPKIPSTAKAGDKVTLADGQERTIVNPTPDSSDEIELDGWEQPGFVRADGKPIMRYERNATKWVVTKYTPAKPTAFEIPKTAKKGDVVILADGQRRAIELAAPDFDGEIRVEGYDPSYVRQDGEPIARYSTKDGQDWRPVGFEVAKPRAKPKAKAKAKAKAKPKPKPTFIALPADIAVGDTIILANGDRRVVDYTNTSKGTDYVSIMGSFPGYVRKDGKGCEFYNATEREAWRPVGVDKAPVKAPVKAFEIPSTLKDGDVLIMSDGSEAVVRRARPDSDGDIFVHNASTGEHYYIRVRGEQRAGRASPVALKAVAYRWYTDQEFIDFAVINANKYLLIREIGATGFGTTAKPLHYGTYGDFLLCDGNHVGKASFAKFEFSVDGGKTWAPLGVRN